MTASVPVLVITGPVGVGKSTVAAEAARLLREANVPHALVDLAWIEQCWPVPADDPSNERLTHRNLDCMWANFRQAGADRLFLVRVLEARSLLRPVAEAGAGRRDHSGPASSAAGGAACAQNYLEVAADHCLASWRADRRAGAALPS